MILLQCYNSVKYSGPKYARPAMYHWAALPTIIMIFGFCCGSAQVFQAWYKKNVQDISAMCGFLILQTSD